jgi:hypothetical protein
MDDIAFKDDPHNKPNNNNHTHTKGHSRKWLFEPALK